MVQDILVWALFVAIIVYAVYRWVKKPKHGGCAKCEFNAEAKK